MKPKMRERLLSKRTVQHSLRYVKDLYCNVALFRMVKMDQPGLDEFEEVTFNLGTRLLLG